MGSAKASAKQKQSVTVNVFHEKRRRKSSSKKKKSSSSKTRVDFGATPIYQTVIPINPFYQGHNIHETNDTATRINMQQQLNHEKNMLSLHHANNEEIKNLIHRI